MEQDKDQCQENFRVWRRETGAPEMPVVRAERDRVLFLWTDDWEGWVSENLERCDAGIDRHRPFGKDTAEAGWREGRPFWAVQIIRHSLGGDSINGEADVDFGNPICGLTPSVVHGVEWLWHQVPKLFGGQKKITGPFLAASAFRRRGWKVRDVREVQV